LIDRVVIVGSGALATFYAYEWSQQFHVSVLASWEESICALNLVDKKKQGRYLKATANWKTIKEPDLTIWITKTYKNKESLTRYSALDWKCPILILQNGIGQEGLFKEYLGFGQKIFRGITTQGAKLTRPGKVLNTGDGQVIVEKDNLFNGFPVIQSENIENDVYLKLAVNAVLNPIAAMFNVENKDAIVGEAGKFLRKLVKNCYPYFKKRKIFISEVAYLKHVEFIALKTGTNLNSMLSDKKTKRKTEVLEILGPINNELNNKELEKIIALLNF
jgi:2-dehydropantoate 2-reductase